MITEAFQSRIVRQYFKENKSEDIDLSDPSVPSDDLDQNPIDLDKF